MNKKTIKSFNDLIATREVLINESRNLINNSYLTVSSYINSLSEIIDKEEYKRDFNYLNKANNKITSLLTSLEESDSLEDIIKIRKKINYYLNKVKYKIRSNELLSDKEEEYKNVISLFRKTLSYDIRIIKREKNLDLIKSLINKEDINEEEYKTLRNKIQNEKRFNKRLSNVFASFNKDIEEKEKVETNVKTKRKNTWVKCIKERKSELFTNLKTKKVVINNHTKKNLYYIPLYSFILLSLTASSQKGLNHVYASYDVASEVNFDDIKKNIILSENTLSNDNLEIILNKLDQDDDIEVLDDTQVYESPLKTEENEEAEENEVEVIDKEDIEVLDQDGTVILTEDEALLGSSIIGKEMEEYLSDKTSIDSSNILDSIMIPATEERETNILNIDLSNYMESEESQEQLSVSSYDEEIKIKEIQEEGIDEEIVEEEKEPTYEEKSYMVRGTHLLTKEQLSNLLTMLQEENPFEIMFSSDEEALDYFYNKEELDYIDKMMIVMAREDLSYKELDSICAGTIAEGGNYYDETYRVMSVIYNRSCSKKWTNSYGFNLYSHFVAPSQFAVYSNGSYRKYLGSIDMDGYMGALDMIYSLEPSVDYLKFNGKSSDLGGIPYEQFFSNGNKFFSHMGENDYIPKEYMGIIERELNEDYVRLTQGGVELKKTFN